MKTPDVTPVQAAVGAIAALVSALLACLAAFDVALSAEQIAAVGGLVTALGSVFVIADAVIRNGRSRALGVPPRPAMEEEDPSA